jgi:hypothetical protein
MTVYSGSILAGWGLAAAGDVVFCWLRGLVLMCWISRRDLQNSVKPRVSVISSSGLQVCCLVRMRAVAVCMPHVTRRGLILDTGRPLVDLESPLGCRTIAGDQEVTP